MDAGCDKSGVVCHIDHKQCVDGASDFGEACVVDFARVSAGTGHDHAWFVFAGQSGHLIEIDAVVVLSDSIMHRFVQFSAEIQVHPVCEVSAVSQIHSQDRISGFQHGHVDRHVGLRTGVWLHVGMFGFEQLAGAIACEVFHDIDIFAAAVVATAGGNLRRTYWSVRYRRLP